MAGSSVPARADLERFLVDEGIEGVDVALDFDREAEGGDDTANDDG